MRGDAASTGNSNFQGNTAVYSCRASKWNTTQVQEPKHTKRNPPKPIVRSYLTLDITHALITPKLLLLIKTTPKLLQLSCPPSAANTMLGICYTCCGIVLQRTWVLCCGAQYCMLCCTVHSHCNPYSSNL